MIQSRPAVHDQGVFNWVDSSVAYAHRLTFLPNLGRNYPRSHPPKRIMQPGPGVHYGADALTSVPGKASGARAPVMAKNLAGLRNTKRLPKFAHPCNYDKRHWEGLFTCVESHTSASRQQPEPDRCEDLVRYKAVRSRPEER
jgi:hypothetical protein